MVERDMIDRLKELKEALYKAEEMIDTIRNGTVNPLLYKHIPDLMKFYERLEHTAFHIHQAVVEVEDAIQKFLSVYPEFKEG